MVSAISSHNIEKEFEEGAGVRLVTPTENAYHTSVAKSVLSYLLTINYLPAKFLNLPEDEGEGIGFRLTRTLWDPYPWVREVIADSRADLSGLKAGDCILQADGKDLLGLPVSQVAGLIRGDGSSRGVSLLVWSCGINPQDDPELLWSAGGGVREEKARRALVGVLSALSCAVCGATAAAGLNCARSHVYCDDCWTRLQRCALCRELLLPKDDPRARNLVAQQVFEAIAKEYEIKYRLRRPKETVSARTSPSVNRKDQYQLSMMKSKKVVQFGNRFHQNYASDPNLSVNINNTRSEENPQPGNTNNDSCQNCNKAKASSDVPRINIENSDVKVLGLHHKLITRLRPATSLADLKITTIETALSKSLNCVHNENCSEKRCGSLDNMKTRSSNSICETPLVLLSAPPIYVLSCEHISNENLT